MKKILIPTLCLAFLLATTPVIAADNSGNWLTRLSKLFSIFTGFPSQNPPFIDNALTPTPFQKGSVSPRDDWPTGTPKGYGRPTDITRPTAKISPGVNGSDNGRGKPGTTGKPDVTGKPSDFENRGKSNGPKGPTGVGEENKSDKVLILVNRILDSYTNRLSNYSDFLTKVKSRRDKLAAEGKDVSRLTAFIGTASDNLTSAQNELASVKTQVAGIDYNGSVKDIRSALRPLLTKLRQAMTDLHKSMSETVQEIVDRSVSPKNTDTPKVHETGRPDNPGENGKGRGNSTK